jgi:hypothetical protein
MIRRLASVVRFALEHPIGALIALSFAVMTVVVGVERLEQGPPAIEWLRRHHASVALFKQALCMTAIPGFLVLMFWDSKANPRDPRRPS